MFRVLRLVIELSSRMRTLAVPRNGWTGQPSMESRGLSTLVPSKLYAPVVALPAKTLIPEAEAAVRDWAAAAPERTAVILRFAPVYGPNNQANLAAFTKQIILGRPSLAGDGQAKKSILSRENAVQAVYHALHRIRGRCELFNVADPRPIALCDLASLIAGCCDAPPPRRIPRLLATAIARAGDAFEALTGREFALDSRRLRVLLSDSVFPIDKLLQSGFVPQQSTADGIAEMAAWVRDQG